jgi:ubiquinone/menaquinone biosynthesis C-methylase UbiE
MAIDYADLKHEMVSLYRDRARHYDFTANLYYLIGYPEWRYRQQTVAALDVQPGDTVVEIGCGTGLNFELLQQHVGPSGQLIGVDLTDAMLQQARKRVLEEGWQNVTLVQADALAYPFPAGVERVISTYALSLIPRCDQIIERAAQALAPGGRLALLELQLPENWPNWLVNLAMATVQPFALTEEWLARKPWPTIKRAMQENLDGVSLEVRYLRTTYIISGQKV